MTRPKSKALTPAVPLNFLLTCSEATLDSFQLAKLAAVANLRSELHNVLDKLIEEAVEAGLARWFKNHGRDEIKHAIENPPDILAEAREMIRTRGKSQEEIRPIRPLPPGMAVLDRRDPDLRAVTPPLTAKTYVERYGERNRAEGKCRACPKPLAPNSVCYCETHLAMQRERQRKPHVGTKDEPPGSVAWLYGGAIEKQGKQAGPREKYYRSSEAENALYSRVATQLGVSPAHVRQVALGQRRSKAILAALKEALGPEPAKQAIAALAPSGLRQTVMLQPGRTRKGKQR